MEGKLQLNSCILIDSLKFSVDPVLTIKLKKCSVVNVPARIPLKGMYVFEQYNETIPIT